MERARAALNLHIGARLRARRKALGLTLADVAEPMGMSVQSLAKYETGQVRIPADCLGLLAHVLVVPAGHFFEAFPPAQIESAISRVNGGGQAPDA